ncbi:uncharacterized protein LOC135393979 [Ornithodoros turicata]|uniref:uncharacterized protein LOC135393979 n=1 Tax=Ornithodoros turicata TaxID=34597 RepID=UPI003138FE22
MATAATENVTFVKTLSGFTKEVNWRPTEFTTPIPRIRCCNLCSVVPREARVLRCSHVFCKACYDRIANSDFVCPLDDKHFSESQANVIEFSQLQLLTREVRCWNRGNGCMFVGHLSDALAHFHEACDFHMVTCAKCNSSVVQREILEHYKRRCAEENPRRARVSQQRNQSGESPGHTTPASGHSTLDNVLQIARNIEGMINQLADNQASLQDSLNNFTVSTRDGLREVSCSILNQTSQIGQVSEKQDEFNSMSKNTMTNIEVSLKGLPGMLHHQNRLKNVAPQTFHLSSDKVCWPIEDIMRHIQNESLQKIMGEPFMLGGYRVRLTLKFDRSESDMEICLYFSLRPGPNDADQDWPFIIPLKMSLVPPNEKIKEKKRLIDPVSSRYPEIFRRPTEDVDHGEGGCIVKRSEMEPYVIEGTLLVCIELIRDRDVHNALFMEAVVEAVAGLLS